MADTEKTPKMSITAEEDGSLTYTFAHGEKVSVKLEDFSDTVQRQCALLGLRTKLRNFTAAEKDEAGQTLTSEEMAKKLMTGLNALKSGAWRTVSDSKGGSTTAFLEAAIMYRRDKATSQGLEFTETPEQVAAALEALDEAQIKQLKASTGFKLAQAKVAAARAAERLQKLAAQEGAPASDAAPF